MIHSTLQHIYSKASHTFDTCFAKAFFFWFSESRELDSSAIEPKV